MEELEVWRDVEEFIGYQVSNLGNVRRFKGNQWLIVPQRFDKDGYKRCNLSKKINGKQKQFTRFVHRLVGLAFLPNPDNLPQINHKNEIKSDNRLINLEFCTAKYNMNYGTATQRRIEKISKAIVCMETGVVYPSQHEAARALNIPQDCISKNCTGIIKQTHGLHFEFL